MRRIIFPVVVLTLGLLAWAQQPYPQGSQYPQGPQYPPPQGFPSQGPPPQGQPPQGQDDPADAAEHGVARLSLVNGSVTVIRGDSGEPVGSAVNAPLVTIDRVTTGDGSRAEIQFDPASMIRLGAKTEVRMGDLQYRHYLVQISQGTTLFRVLRDTDAQIEISTPSVSVTPLRQGIYRVTVRPDGSSEITVRAGEADLVSLSGTERLSAGQTILSRGPANDPEFMNVAAIPFDEWDRWNADRDRFFERLPDASRYAPPDIDGTQELANYGRWVWDPNYGYVWVPGNVPPDWAPYRDGRWDYLDYYGWSWVSYDPWGWAPYHYGNWYRASFGWAWYPGAIGPRHYWRPAMVGFFGFGEPGFGVSLGFGYGNIGWVPLAPFERFHPWYGRGFVGGRNLAIVSNINIASTYRNAGVNGAVTGLRAGDFGRVGVSRNAFVRPDSGELARAGMARGGMPLSPARPASNNVFRFNGGAPNAGSSNAGGWRRLESQPSAPAVGGNRSDVRNFSSQPQQPVRISPSIVNNRYNIGAPGGFGGPRPNSVSGFGAPPVQQGTAATAAAPRGNGGFYRAPQSVGAPRSAPPSGGGGNRGGGPHGGGGHAGGHGR